MHRRWTAHQTIRGVYSYNAYLLESELVGSHHQLLLVAAAECVRPIANDLETALGIRGHRGLKMHFPGLLSTGRSRAAQFHQQRVVKSSMPVKVGMLVTLHQDVIVDGVKLGRITL